MNLFEIKIGIVGLGYVRIPLAIEFGRKYQVIGYDTNQRWIAELTARKNDFTREVTKEELASAKHL